jgi:radical SAM/Cys-rich protein
MREAEHRLPLAVAVAAPVAVTSRSEGFHQRLQREGAGVLARARVETLQVNVGKLCNMACHHCHVEAGPKRTEIMTRDTVDQALRVLDGSPEVTLVDLTGGAPELNPSFRFLVTEVRRRGVRVIDRCNLSVLFEPEQDDLVDFLAAQEVHVVASLPCYSAGNVDAQRGKGAFDKSVDALRALNARGYGQPGSHLALDLVYNPVGATLPPAQAGLESAYKAELHRRFGLSFHKLLTITNMPIARFAHALARDGAYDAYMALLVNHFNARTARGLMCRTLVSVGWDGRLYDCDFNQMLELPLGAEGPRHRATIAEISDLASLEGAPIRTADHCFGCTAGAGSSCSGAVA